MAVRKVAVMGHPVLRQVAKPVPDNEILTPRIQTLIHDMVETMFEYDGRGLAAPQVYESIQIVVMLWDFEPKEEASILCLINPELRPLTKEASTYWEGCLSLPGLRGKVSRPSKVALTAFNQKKEKVEMELEGFAATVIQHECDHLLGKLYVDRMTDFTQFAFNREYAKFLATDEDLATPEEG
jgi:peptide deformylase